MAKASKKTKETKKKKKVEKEKAKASKAPEVTEESKEPEKAAEEELTEEEILEEPEEEEIEAEETKETKAAKKEEAEEEIVEERIYTIPLDKAWISPRKNRTPKAVRMVKSFIQRHMKPEALLISNEVNERIWSRGIRKPPRRIRVRAAKDTEGTVTLYLAEGD